MTDDLASNTSANLQLDVEEQSKAGLIREFGTAPTLKIQTATPITATYVTKERFHYDMHVTKCPRTKEELLELGLYPSQLPEKYTRKAFIPAGCCDAAPLHRPIRARKGQPPDQNQKQLVMQGPGAATDTVSTKLSMITPSCHEEPVEPSLIRLNREYVMLPPSPPDLTAWRHFRIEVDGDIESYSRLCDLYKVIRPKKAVIFCSVRKRTTRLAIQLKAYMKFEVGRVRSGMKADKLQKFLESDCWLVNADLSEAGACVHATSSIVINYDLPANPSNYACRVWQCGLGSDARGIIINFVRKCEARQIPQFESFCGTMEEMPADFGDIVHN